MICGICMRAAGPVAGLEAMLAALPGRTADATAPWTDGAAALGWRGEPVANEDRTERLPLVDRNAGLAVVADARLDERESLCEALGVSGPERRLLPDGALILRAYGRWGLECPDHLLGDYAFALWDAKDRTLLCARDHIGARPFYYSLTADRIVFASDVNAVLAAPGVSDELDERAVATRLTFGARSLGAHTFFRDIRRLPPGHRLVIEEDSTRIERWWRPENAPPAPAGDDEALAEAFLELYSRAIEDRVSGPHPVGVHLSGGLDSSSVAVLAARALRRAGRAAPSAFSWQPPPGVGARNAPEAAEYDLIEAVARQEGLPVIYCPPGVDDLVAWLRRDATRHPNGHENEEPVQRRAAELGVRVLLSGWGGDEGISFNARGFYAELLLSGRWGRLWREIGDSARHPLATIVAGVALPLASPSAARALRALRYGGRRVRNRTFIHPAFARRVPPLPEPPRTVVGVRRVQLHLLGNDHLGDRIEGWAACGARQGIEYRYPLLDRRVIEFALGLPPEQFRRGRWSRWLMRLALDRILPPEVAWNRGKEDPCRAEELSRAFVAALPVVRGILDARPAPPSRSPYVDLPRLLAWLDADRFGSDSRLGPGPIRNALRFLDF